MKSTRGKECESCGLSVRSRNSSRASLTRVALAFFIIISLSGIASSEQAQPSIPLQAIGYAGSAGSVGNAQPETAEGVLRTAISQHQPEGVLKTDITAQGVKSYEYMLPTYSFSISTHSREFTPEPIAKSGDGYLLDDYDNEYYLIQLDDPQSFEQIEADINEMKEDGIEFLGVYQPVVLVARVPKGLFSRSTYNSVRWVGILQPQDKMRSGDLEKLRTGGKEAFVTVLLFDEYTPEMLARIRGAGAEVLYAESRAITVKADADILERLLEMNMVGYADLVSQQQALLDTSGKVILADHTRPLLDSSSVTVGVIDTGIAHTNTYFVGPDGIPGTQDDSVRIFDGYDFYYNDTFPEANESGHGTNVAAIISGSGTYNGRYIVGIAKNPALTVVKYLGINGSSPPWFASNEDRLWKSALDPDNDNGFYEQSSADVISVSWGGGNYGAYDATSYEIDRVVTGEVSGGRKVLVVTATGNNGTYHGVNTEASAKNGLAVGATADYETDQGYCRAVETGYAINKMDRANLYLMNYSQIGTQGGRVKPDILAPGSFITTSNNSNVFLSIEGTSFATPHVSAAAAQLLSPSAYPQAGPALIKAILINSAVGGGTTDNMNLYQAWGRLDAFHAIFRDADVATEDYSQATVGNWLTSYPSEISYSISVPPGARRLVTTLAYLDAVPYFPNEGLVNDIDLYLINPSGQRLFEGDDHVNTVEKYSISSPTAGVWEFHVKLRSSPPWPESADFGLAISVIKETEPMSMNILLSGDRQVEGQYYIGNLNDQFAVTATAQARGMRIADVRESVSGSPDMNILNPCADGTDQKYAVPGDIRAGFDRSKVWNLQFSTPGLKTISVNGNATRFDNTFVQAQSSITVNVCDFDNDGYYNQTCSQGPQYNDCNDFDSNTHPGALEICDGKDNDCDGSIDELTKEKDKTSCSCIPGESRPCGTDTGLCQRGTQTCSGSGSWGGCVGEIPPASEVCDGQDNDCDGQTDENVCGWPPGTCYNFLDQNIPNPYVSVVRWGPFCGNLWRYTELNGDPRCTEAYMLIGETYRMYGECETRNGAYVFDFTNNPGTYHYGCIGGCDSTMEWMVHAVPLTTPWEKYDFYDMFCQPSIGQSQGWNSNNALFYCDLNGNEQWDPGIDMQEPWYVINCAQDSDCAGNQICRKPSPYLPSSWNCGPNNPPVILDLMQTPTSVLRGQSINIRCQPSDFNETISADLQMTMKYRRGGSSTWETCSGAYVENQYQWDSYWRCPVTTGLTDSNLGSWDFECYAYDGHLQSPSVIDWGTVSVGNNNPIMQGCLNATIAEDSQGSQVQVNLAACSSDAEDASLSYSILSQNSTLINCYLNNNVLTCLDPGPQLTGRSTITVRAQDSDGGTATGTIIVDVTPVNDIPNVYLIDPQDRYTETNRSNMTFLYLPQDIDSSIQQCSLSLGQGQQTPFLLDFYENWADQQGVNGVIYSYTFQDGIWSNMTYNPAEQKWYAATNPQSQFWHGQNRMIPFHPGTGGGGKYPYPALVWTVQQDGAYTLKGSVQCNFNYGGLCWNPADQGDGFDINITVNGGKIASYDLTTTSPKNISTQLGTLNAGDVVRIIVESRANAYYDWGNFTNLTIEGSTQGSYASDNQIENSQPNYFTANLSDGEYDWSVSCSDGLGTGYSETWRLYMNLTPQANTPPLVMNLSSWPATAYRGEDIVAYCVVIDAQTPLQNLNVTIEFQRGSEEGWNDCPAAWNSSGQSWDCTTQADLTDDALGWWDFRCKASDGLNETEWSWNNESVFVMNNQPLFQEMPGQQIEEDALGSQIFIDLWQYASDVEDATAMLAYGILVQTNASLVNCSIQENRNFSCSNPAPDASGISVVTIEAVDSDNGNGTAYMTVQVTPVNDLPVVSLIDPLNNTFVFNSTIMFTYLPEDVDSLIQECSLSLSQQQAPFLLDFYTNWADQQGVNGVFYRYTFQDGIWSNMTYSAGEQKWYAATNPQSQFWHGQNRMIPFHPGTGGGGKYPYPVLEWVVQQNGVYMLSGIVQCGFDFGGMCWDPSVGGDGFEINITVNGNMAASYGLSVSTPNQMNASLGSLTVGDIVRITVESRGTSYYDWGKFVNLTIGTMITVINANDTFIENNQSNEFTVGLENGQYNWNVSCRDEEGQGFSETRVLQVNYRVNNSPPTLESIGNRWVEEGRTLRLQLNASDADNDAPVYTTNAGSVLPSPFSFNSTDGRFSWTPWYNASGYYNVTFNASDGFGGSDEETVTITVIDRPPTPGKPRPSMEGP